MGRGAQRFAFACAPTSQEPCRSSSEHSPPPRLLYGLLRLYRSRVGPCPLWLLLARLRLHLLLPSFLPDLLQQLPPRISDSEHRAVNVIVIRKSLPFVPQVLSLLLALQQIVLDHPPHRGVAADPIESRLLRVSPARGERSVQPIRVAILASAWLVLIAASSLFASCVV